MCLATKIVTNEESKIKVESTIIWSRHHSLFLKTTEKQKR